MLHLLALTYGVGAVITAGNAVVWPADVVSLHTLLFFLGIMIACYALLQLYSVVTTISAIGVVIISEAAQGGE